GTDAPDNTKGEVMGKLEGKVAVITGGSSGLALASAKRFVEEGAYVFITGRRQEQLDEAVKQIGRNVTGVRGDASNLNDLDRLFDIGGSIIMTASVSYVKGFPGFGVYAASKAALPAYARTCLNAANESDSRL